MNEEGKKMTSVAYIMVYKNIIAKSYFEKYWHIK